MVWWPKVKPRPKKKTIENSIELGLSCVGVVILVHILLCLVLLVIALCSDIMKVTTWAQFAGLCVLNAVCGMLTGIWVGVCFSSNSTVGKIIFYPIGGILLLAVLVGLAFPVAIVSAIVGTCAGSS